MYMELTLILTVLFQYITWLYCKSLLTLGLIIVVLEEKVLFEEKYNEI